MLSGNRTKLYNFDQVFNQSHDQDDVYDGLGITNYISKVVEGYHATILAYGQTGSGKTFTMEGNERNMDSVKDSALRNNEIEEGIT